MIAAVAIDRQDAAKLVGEKELVFDQDLLGRCVAYLTPEGGHLVVAGGACRSLVAVSLRRGLWIHHILGKAWGGPEGVGLAHFSFALCMAAPSECRG
jgi:hypothetical protein